MQQAMDKYVPDDSLVREGCCKQTATNRWSHGTIYRSKLNRSGNISSCCAIMFTLHTHASFHHWSDDCELHYYKDFLYALFIQYQNTSNCNNYNALLTIFEMFVEPTTTLQIMITRNLCGAYINNTLCDPVGRIVNKATKRASRSDAQVGYFMLWGELFKARFPIVHPIIKRLVN